MTTPLLRALTERHGLPRVDEASLDAFLAPDKGESAHALLFFPGAGANRPETGDVAVVLPELLKSFSGRLRGAVVAPEAEEKLKGRFQVFIFPSLVVMRGADPVGVLPKICDWSEYRQKIEAFLDPEAPVLGAAKESGARPRVEFTHSRGTDA
jgi:hydrogenase-1 operon protein HyaE